MFGTCNYPGQLNVLSSEFICNPELRVATDIIIGSFNRQTKIGICLQYIPPNTPHHNDVHRLDHLADVLGSLTSLTLHQPDSPKSTSIHHELKRLASNLAHVMYTHSISISFTPTNVKQLTASCVCKANCEFL